MSLLSFAPTPQDVASAIRATPLLRENTSVGLCHFHALDEARDDVSTGKRQFMVSVFYPAVADEAAPRARLTDVWAPQQEAALEILLQSSGFSFKEKSALKITCQSLTLRTQRDLKPIKNAPLPVLISYPGGASHRLSNAALCERLANVGYIVFTLDAPRDAPFVVFPNGQMVPFVPDNDEDYIWPRVADVRFLLDNLAELNARGPFAGLLDLSCIGMFGHSRGGYLSNICAVEDPRIHAAVNMDGFLWGLWTQGTGLAHYPTDFQARARALKTPILRLCSEQENEQAAQARFDEEVQDFGGDFIFAVLAGFGHGSFVTTPWMNGTPENLPQSIAQEPPPVEQIELLGGCLTDFFDTYLKGEHPGTTFLASNQEGVQQFLRRLT